MAKEKQENGNLIVLGIIIRSRRIEYGYSLRTLADITRISHTLISNIEKGKQTPAKDTLSELFKALDLKYYDDLEEITIGRDRIEVITKLIMHQEYAEAEKELDILMKKEEIYIYSPLIIDYILIKYVFYAITNKHNTDIDDAIEHYSNVEKFFGPIQQQLWKFVVGLNHLNHEQYNKAQEAFNEGLSIGSKKYDVFIKEYEVISMVRQYKFMDAQRVAQSIIKEYEQRTIYIRAMKVKLQLARIYLVIQKKNEIEEILDQVETFSKKFNINELNIELNMIKAEMAIREKDFDKAEIIISNIPLQKSIEGALVRFKLEYEKGRLDEIEKIYRKILTYPQVINHYKIPKYLGMKVMYKIPRLYNEKLYLEYVTFLCEKSVENNDQDIVGIAYNHLLEFYYSKRQYKKATEVAQDFLHNKKLLKKL